MPGARTVQSGVACIQSGCTRFGGPSEQASVALLISEPFVSPFKGDFMFSRDESGTRS